MDQDDWSYFLPWGVLPENWFEEVEKEAIICSTPLIKCECGQDKVARPEDRSPNLHQRWCPVYRED